MLLVLICSILSQLAELTDDVDAFIDEFGPKYHMHPKLHVDLDFGEVGE
jgi:hypothetical protein